MTILGANAGNMKRKSKLTTNKKSSRAAAITGEERWERLRFGILVVWQLIGILSMLFVVIAMPWMVSDDVASGVLGAGLWGARFYKYKHIVNGTEHILNGDLRFSHSFLSGTFLDFGTLTGAPPEPTLVAPTWLVIHQCFSLLPLVMQLYLYVCVSMYTSDPSGRDMGSLLRKQFPITFLAICNLVWFWIMMNLSDPGLPLGKLVACQVTFFMLVSQGFSTLAALGLLRKCAPAQDPNNMAAQKPKTKKVADNKDIVYIEIPHDNQFNPATCSLTGSGEGIRRL